MCVRVPFTMLRLTASVWLQGAPDFAKSEQLGTSSVPGGGKEEEEEEE